MRRICVFCGSSPGSRPEYRAATEELGAELARRNIGLVYGGGNVGLMGVLTDAVLRTGGPLASTASRLP
jgi:predicted Rossmann-fold nucleotide-binding protein